MVVNTPAPMRRRRSGGGGRRRRRRTRRAGGGGGGDGSYQKRIQGVALGGLAYGLLIKHFPTLPRLPGVGRSGTVALAAYFLKPKNQIMRDAGIAAAAIAGASFGETGSVSGDGEEVLDHD